MAGHVPDWVHASIQQGYIVKARCPDGDISRVAFGEKGYLLFGRNGQVCECEVAHKSASRVHACLGFDGDQFQIQDLDSSHGTFVDGKRLEKSAKALVVPGRSVINIGRCLTEYTLLLDFARHGQGEGVPATGAAEAAQHVDRDSKRTAADMETLREPNHHRHSGNLEAGPADRQAREHVRRDVPRGHEASRGRARAEHQPSSREGLRQDSRDRRPPHAGSRAPEYRDDHRSGKRGRGGHWRRHSPPGRDSSRTFDAHGSSRDHRAKGGYRRSNEPDRHNQRRNGRHSRSPEAPRNRKSAESEGEDERHAAEERRRKRKTAFDDAPAAAASAAPQQTAAQIVMGMMGAGGMPLPAGMLNAEQKKKLLWGKKAVEVEAAPVTEAFGANRWDTAEFSNDSEKEKFIKLMGVKKVPTVPTAAMAQAQPASPTEREALTREKQDRLLHNVEAQFMAGLRRADGRTVGLGL